MEPESILQEGVRKYSRKFLAAGDGRMVLLYRMDVPQVSHNRVLISTRLPMDVTDKESILHARDAITEKEGKLHILANKLVTVNIDYTSFPPSYMIQCWSSWSCI
jgi:hypothetical protein